MDTQPDKGSTVNTQGPNEPKWNTSHSLFEALGLEAHPVRYQLMASPPRPNFIEAIPPCHILHIAAISAQNSFRSVAHRLMEWATTNNLKMPVHTYDHLNIKWSTGQLIWHTQGDLHLYTLVLQPLEPEEFKAFDPMSLTTLPSGLFPFPGQVINAMWIDIVAPSATLPVLEDAGKMCDGPLTVVSSLWDNKLSVWSPAHPHTSGFTRLLLQPYDLDPQHIGTFINAITEAESLRLSMYSRRPAWEELSTTLRAEVSKLTSLEQLGAGLTRTQLVERIRILMSAATILEKDRRRILDEITSLQALADAACAFAQDWNEIARYGYITYSDFLKHSLNHDVHMWQNLYQDHIAWQDHIQRLGLLLHAQALNSVD